MVLYTGRQDIYSPLVPPAPPGVCGDLSTSGMALQSLVGKTVGVTWWPPARLLCDEKLLQGAEQVSH